MLPQWYWSGCTPTCIHVSWSNSDYKLFDKAVHCLVCGRTNDPEYEKAEGRSPQTDSSMVLLYLVCRIFGTHTCQALSNSLQCDRETSFRLIYLTCESTISWVQIYRCNSTKSCQIAKFRIPQNQLISSGFSYRITLVAALSGIYVAFMIRFLRYL